MHQEQQITEFNDIHGQKDEQKEKPRKIFLPLLDGSFLGKDSFLEKIPYIMFLGLLTIIYITNTFHAERILRDCKRLELEIRELQPEAISISSQLMLMSNQTEVAKLCRDLNLGLKENLEPPYKIVLESDDIDLIERKKIK